MDADRRVTVAFGSGEASPVELAVDLEGRGEGRVESAPAGIDCGDDCEQSFEPGTRVTLNFAGSSELAAQINEGAPADVFASANKTQMHNVVEAGNISAGPIVFVHNALIIIAPDDNPANLQL